MNIKERVMKMTNVSFYWGDESIKRDASDADSWSIMFFQ